MPEPPSLDVALDDAPTLRPGVARATIGEVLLIGHERVGRVIALDPVMSILVGGLDGATTLEDLSLEVADAGGQPIEASRGFVLALVERLRSLGFLEGPVPPGVQPRRADVRLDAESCLGRRWGLSRATTLQVTGNDGFRISCTAADVLEPVERALSAEGQLCEPDFELMDTIHLRAVRGRVARTQVIFDTLDSVWFAGRDWEGAVEAFHRTIEGRLRIRAGGAWMAGPSVEREGRIVLVHPSVWDLVTSAPSLRTLRARGCNLTPGGLLWTDGLEVCLPGDRFDGRPDRSLRAVGMVEVGEFGPVERVRQALHLLRWWDGSGFRAMVRLAPALASVDAGSGDPVALAHAMADCLDLHFGPLAGP